MNPRHHERTGFLVVAALGMVCSTVLFALHEPMGAGAIVVLTNGILGMMGWRRAQPIPEGGANLVLTETALSSMSGSLSREAVLRQVDKGDAS